MDKGLLLVGHGSRSLDAQDTFEKIVEMVREKSEYALVEGAHMEICKPDIPTVVKGMVEKNTKEILIVPYFLYEGIHIKEDIPQIINKLAEDYKNVEFKLGRPIGAEPLLVDIILDRGKEIE